MHTQIIEFSNNDLVPLLFGTANEHLSHLEKQLGITISDRGNRLTVSGTRDKVQSAEAILNSMWERLEQKQEVGIEDINAALRFLKPQQNNEKSGTSMPQKQKEVADITIKTKKKTIRPRSPHQGQYLQAIFDHELVFGLGPAGTGKTYLGVAAAVSMYLAGEIERMIFCRPAVEAGEQLGFLPGDMKEKVDPYLRPIYDALQDMMSREFLMKKVALGEIEIAPLAFMRGRTLSNAFVILDEAQNTTPTQMKMFLTRLGESSRMVINGDLTQTDLPIGVKSGLRDATEILAKVEGIAFCEFGREDIIRNPLVSKVVGAYEGKR